MRFSIVIPTRNRAGLLRHALATAVAIDHDDLEILVSDNCSADHTRTVATATGDPRVRYVRSDTPLSNADSWEFAVSHAKGEWITVLGDDDGFVASLVDCIEPIMEEGASDLIAWVPAWYVHPDTDPPWPVEAERNRLSIHPHSGRVLSVDAADQLRRFFSRTEIDPIPSVVNGFVRRTLLDSVAAKVGRVFGEPDPSWSLAAALMTCTSHYTVLDLPLTVAGVSPVNIGGAFLRNRRDHSTAREFDTSDLFAHTPLQVRTCVNVVAESLLRVQAAIPGELDGIELDLARYFVTNWEELTEPSRARDDGYVLDEWRRGLRSCPRPVRSTVRRGCRRSRARSSVRAIARRVPGLQQIVRATIGGTPFTVVSGRDKGFTDIVGATRHLGELIGAPSLSRR